MRFLYIPETETLMLQEADRLEYNTLKNHLTRQIKSAKYNPRVKMKIWDGFIDHFHKGQIKLGLWKEIYDLCKNNNWKFQLDNKEDFPKGNINKESFDIWVKEFFQNRFLKDGITPFFPYDHQTETAARVMKARYCVAEIATGGGKSLLFTLVALYTIQMVKPDAKFLLIVPSISLVTQFYNDIIEYNNGIHNENTNPVDIRLTEIMGDNNKPRVSENPNIVIGTYQSLEKMEASYFKKFYGVVVDEGHGAKQGDQSKLKIINKILSNTIKSAYYRFGMSGTFPKAETVDYLTIQVYMGPKIVEVSAKELIDKGIITPVQINAVILNHDDKEFSEQIQLIKKSGNGKAAFDLERKFVHASKKRNTFLIDRLISKFKANSLCLFNIKEYGYDFYQLCRDSLKNVDVYYIDGDTKSDKREYIKKEMEKTDGNMKLLIASYGVLSTGISIKALTNVVFLDSYKSEQIVIQSIGRSLRLHADKTRANIFDIVDIFEDSVYPKNILFSHFKERKKSYMEREYPLKEVNVRLT